MDVCARGLKAAADLLEDGRLEAFRNERYEAWDHQEMRDTLFDSLETCFDHVLKNTLKPEPKSGQQERLENLLNRFF